MILAGSSRRIGSIPTALLAGNMLAASPVLAADVTPERLLNADKEPQNWLGGRASNEWLEATPLVEDGFLYITDAWGVLYNIDVRSGDVGRIVWRMEPKQNDRRPTAARRCGAIS